MFEWQLVMTGMVIGVAVAAPVGPINIMCIQRSLKQGFRAGLLTGVGSVLGDGMFAAIAAYSITSVSDFIFSYIHWIKLVGGLFLVALGLRTIFVETIVKPPLQGMSVIDNTALVGTTFFMTITNPAMVLGFAALFGGASGWVHLPDNFGGATVLVLAVMTGSFLWWVFLAGAVHFFRNSIAENVIVTVNRFSGSIIALFGAVVLLQVFIAGYGQR